MSATPQPLPQLNPLAPLRLQARLAIQASLLANRRAYYCPSEKPAMKKTTLTRKPKTEPVAAPKNSPQTALKAHPQTELTTWNTQVLSTTQENTLMTAQVQAPVNVQADAPTNQQSDALKTQQPDQQQTTHLHAVPHDLKTAESSSPRFAPASESLDAKALAQAILQQAMTRYHQVGRVKEPTPAQQESTAAESPQGYGVRMRRMTLDLPDSLHRDIKVYCAQKDLQVGLLVRSLLESCFANHRSA